MESVVVNVRLQKSEFEQLQNLAKCAGLPKSTCLRFFYLRGVHAVNEMGKMETEGQVERAEACPSEDVHRVC